MKTLDTTITHETVRRFIRDVFFVDDLDASASFLEEGIIDSTGMLELVAFVEGTFGISIADTELMPENLDSLDKVAAFVERKTQG
jgi:acyl carrier protein